MMSWANTTLRLFRYIIIIGVLLAPALFLSVFGFPYSPHPIPLFESNVTPTSDYYDFSNFYGTLAQILGTILAIVFTISLFVIEIGSSKYHQKFAQRFLDTQMTRVTFAFCFISILILLGLSALNLASVGRPYLVPIIALILFIISTLLFTLFFFDMTEMMVNPKSLSNLYENEMKKYIRKGKIADARDTIQDLSELLIKKIQDHDTGIVYHLFDTLSDIYKSIDNQDGSSKVEILKDINFINCYYSAFTHSITNRDDLKEYIFSRFWWLLSDEQWYNKKQENTLLPELLGTWLNRFIISIINANDFGLFRRHLHKMSHLSINSPHHIYGRIQTSLYDKLSPRLRLLTEETESAMRETDRFLFKINPLSYRSLEVVTQLYHDYESLSEETANSAPKIPLRQCIGAKLSILMEHIKNRNTQSSRPEKRSIDDGYYILNQLNYSLQLYFLYFKIGAFILFKGSQGEIDQNKYINELWRHTTPPDADGIIGNEVPVTYDPVWLTNIYLYGGENFTGWQSTLFGFDNRFEDYHGTSLYIRQYYLLMIARCIQKGQTHLNLPKLGNIPKLQETQPDRLENFFDFLSDFIPEIGSLHESLDHFLAEPEKWDPIFDNHAQEVLESTKDWFESRKSDCERLREEIIKYRGVQPENIERYRRAVIEGYKKGFLIKSTDIASYRPYVYDLKTEGEYKKIELHHPWLRREWFLRDERSHPQHIFNQLGQGFSSYEMSYLVFVLLQNQKIIHQSVYSSSCDDIASTIKEIVEEFKKKGFVHPIIIMPKNIFSKMNEQNIRQLFGEEDYRKIPKIFPADFVKSIIVIDKISGEVIFKSFDEPENTLQIIFKENPEDSLKFGIDICSNVKYTITNENAIRIIDLPNISQKVAVDDQSP